MRYFKKESHRYRTQIGGYKRWRIEVGEKGELLFFSLNKLNKNCLKMKNLKIKYFRVVNISSKGGSGARFGL